MHLVHCEVQCSHSYAVHLAAKVPLSSDPGAKRPGREVQRKTLPNVWLANCVSGEVRIVGVVNW